MNTMNLLVSFLALVTIFTETVPASTSTRIDGTTEAVQDWHSHFDQILIQMCVAEVDRNRTTSAMVKLDQLSNAKQQISDVIKFFTQHYEDNFDNLVRFIGHVPTADLQREACNVLADIIETVGLELINVLRTENFIYEKLQNSVTEADKQFYVNIHTNVSLVISQRISEFKDKIKVTGKFEPVESDPMYEFVPNMARLVDLDSFTAMSNVTEITQLLPHSNQLTFVGKILWRMREESNYKHVFHVLTQIMALKYSRYDFNNCILLPVEKELPSKLASLLTAEYNANMENIQTKEFLHSPDSRVRTRNLLLSPQPSSLWMPFRAATVDDRDMFFICHGAFNCLSVTSYHNVSVPIIFSIDPRNLDRSLSSWYLLMSDDLDSFQIKNTDTDKCLSGSEEKVLENGEWRRRVLFSECSDSDNLSSHWRFTLGEPRQFPMRRYGNVEEKC